MTKDPYRYFRVEARELVEGLTQGVLALEKGAASAELVSRLLRLAHTLKGAARVVKQAAIAELAHRIESALAEHRDGARSVSDAQATALLQLLDQMSALLGSLDAAPVPANTAPDDPPSEPARDAVRIDLRELDSLFGAVAEAGVRCGAVARHGAALAGLRETARALCEQLAARPGDGAPAASSALTRARVLAEELRAALDRFADDLAADAQGVGSSVAAIRDVAHRLRLLPARSVFSALERTVRDAAHALGRAVELDASGGDVQLDGHVLMALKDALMHVVRNAVVHGIEPAAEREAAGKPPRGRVRLVVERQGRRATFVVEDDGRGVDLAAVRAAALARGLVSLQAATAWSLEDALALLRAGGLTTAGSVTELAGRGVGLDVVRATMARLRGGFHIRSVPGRGVTIELQVPISIASMPGLVVEAAGGAAAAIPLDVVRRTLRIEDAAIARTAAGQTIVHDGKVIPFLPLEHALRRARNPDKKRRTWSAVVVRGADRDAAIGVDRLLGTTDLVMRALPAVVEADAVVAGASLDADGHPQLVLDAEGLVAAAARGVEEGRDLAPAAKPPVLVVDDSLTTRMLEQSILESAGYQVHLAVSAEDALAKARERRFGLFVVDVEMPGMDGFGLLTELRADPTLRDIPAILVTSRSAPEDRTRGEQVGARAYIVKAEFDQGQLLRTIRRLMG
ncbi:MAG: response regulator [Deltaproteobacteria bacterium]|nr:response regulator [Deltaproteobacteria bacterium]